MIALLLIILGAFFKSVSDTLDDHFDTSVFRHKNPLVWDANRSTVKTWWITGYKFDPWHISNSLMIVAIILATVLHRYDTLQAPWWAELIVAGVAWNVVFGVFYSKIWRVK